MRKCLNFSKKKIIWVSKFSNKLHNVRISAKSFLNNLSCYTKCIREVCQKWRDPIRSIFSSRSSRTTSRRISRTLKNRPKLNYNKAFLFRCKTVRKINNQNHLLDSHKSSDSKISCKEGKISTISCLPFSRNLKFSSNKSRNKGNFLWLICCRIKKLW